MYAKIDNTLTCRNIFHLISRYFPALFIIVDLNEKQSGWLYIFLREKRAEKLKQNQSR